MLGLTDKTFRKFGSKIPWGNLYTEVLDPSCTEGLEMFDIFKEKWLVFQTPRGVRKLRIPDFKCIDKSVRIRRPALIGDLRLDDIIGTTGREINVTEYSDEDYIMEKFAVEMDAGDRVISWGSFDSFRLATSCVTNLERLYHKEVIEGDAKIQIFLERMRPSGLSERILLRRNDKGVNVLY